MVNELDWRVAERVARDLLLTLDRLSTTTTSEEKLRIVTGAVYHSSQTAEKKGMQKTLNAIHALVTVVNQVGPSPLGDPDALKGILKALASQPSKGPPRATPPLP